MSLRLKPLSSRWRGTLISAACAFLLAALGCSYGITVRRAAGNSLFNAWHASVAESDDLSERTRQTVHRWDLDDLYASNPVDAYARLQDAAVADPQPDLLFALAEMSHLFGRRREKERGEACAYYYLCAGYAYHYLFDHCHKEMEEYDPRFRIACDLYNTGLAKCIRVAQSAHRLDPRQQLSLPTPDGKGFTLSVVHHQFPWKPEEFGPLLFCSDYEVVGLANHYRGYGLGVALIGTRVSNFRTPGSDGSRPDHTYYPHEVSFPITAFFRFEGTIADLRARRAGQLELYNPLAVQTVKVQGRPVPLETDLTTPLAYFLSRTDLDGVENAGLLEPGKILNRTGIYMFEPYQPGKIPVLMVHGLWSTPLTWTVMFNDLRADPTLRKHFQFWFYLYPTGDSYLATAAGLRETLSRLHTELDPRGLDSALNRMVLVGHSMGGLLSKLMTTDSGDDFWRLVSNRPYSTLKARPETKQELARLFFFQRQTSVERVVFIGTPHHGSKLLSPSPVRLATWLIRLPTELNKAVGDIAEQDPQVLPQLRQDATAPSLDLLTPQSPALELLAARQKPADVHYHSIIGDIYGKGKDGSDGLVPYKSAHLDGVDSEIIVPAGHTRLHQHPRAVIEVGRILMEHLQEIQARTASVPPPRLDRVTGGAAAVPPIAPR
jgi:pimeloyl-ACP methyl ester carboxylesterase